MRFNKILITTTRVQAQRSAAFRRTNLVRLQSSQLQMHWAYLLSVSTTLLASTGNQRPSVHERVNVLLAIGFSVLVVGHTL